MKNLMKAEWFKLSKSFGFKVLCLCNAATVFSTCFLVAHGAQSTGFESFVINLTYILHHAVIGYLFAAIFLCGEFSNRTYGLSLLCGYSRKEVFMSKVLMLLLGLTGLFLIYTGITTAVMSIANGFGQTDYMEVLVMLLCGILGNAAMGAVIIFIAALTKKAFVTIGIGMGVTYALLWSETNLSEHSLSFVKYAYTYQIGQLQLWGEGFSLWMFLAVTLLTFVIALAASIFIFDHTEKLM